MNDHHPEPSVGRSARCRNRLTAGFDVLDDWSRTAAPAARATVYRALFAVVDGSLHRSFQTMSHRARPGELLVCLGPDLVLAICWTGQDRFGIGYLGAPDGAPGIGCR